MFSKKKPEGTEDQAYDLMNLGGFGGLKRKSSPGTEASQPPQAQQKPSIPQQVLEQLLAWGMENVRNNPKNDKSQQILQLVSQHKTDKDVLHIAEIIFDSFDKVLEDQDSDAFVNERDKVESFIATTNRQQELSMLASCIANLYAANIAARMRQKSESADSKQIVTIMGILAQNYSNLMWASIPYSRK